MATIELYAYKVNMMSGYIERFIESVIDYSSALTILDRGIKMVDQSICNLSNIISWNQASTQMSEKEIESLEKFYEKNEDFISNTARTDGDVADTINELKDKFYEEYDYLKPDCEKDFWEKAAECLASAAEWCVENWDYVLSVYYFIASVVTVVALVICACVLAPEILGITALVVLGIIALCGFIAVAEQFISDFGSYADTGEWPSKWEDYVGEFLGGLTLGSLSLMSFNPVGSAAISEGIATLSSECLKNITGEQDKPFSTILLETFFGSAESAATEAAGEALGKGLVNSKAFKSFRNYIEKSFGNTSFGRNIVLLLDKSTENINGTSGTSPKGKSMLDNALDISGFSDPITFSIGNVIDNVKDIIDTLQNSQNKTNSSFSSPGRTHSNSVSGSFSSPGRTYSNSFNSDLLNYRVYRYSTAPTFPYLVRP